VRAGESGSSVPLLGPRYSVSGARAPTLTPAQQETRSAILRADRPEDYESVPCPCGAANTDLLLAEVDRHGLPCRNVVCTVCGLIRLSPRWREDRYRRFYETEYRSLYNPSTTPKREYARQLASSPALAERCRWVVAAHARYSRPGPVSIVEIGAGGGWNLAGLPRAWERIGYDVDEEYLAIAGSEFGHTVRRGFVEEALDQVSSADLVLLSHVVEHFTDPEAALRAMAERMRPGALLLIEVPGIFRIHRTNLDPVTYLQNAHPYTFCAATLRQVCARAGLAVIEIDEEVRAVCQAGGPAGGRMDPGSPGLARRIIRYLRLCDLGNRQYRRLRSVPGAGAYLAYAWRLTYFAGLGALAPGPRG
jgi:SAM-dependent methyltransferase